jgi:hypothetical protein
MIKGDFLLSQVFFALARDMPNSHGAAPLHPLSVANIRRHTRLADADRLVDAFTAINKAFQTIGNDPEATLFGFDQQGHVFIHQATHDSIRQLSEQLFAAHAPMASGLRCLGSHHLTPAKRGHRSPRARFSHRQLLNRISNERIKLSAPQACCARRFAGHAQEDHILDRISGNKS